MSKSGYLWRYGKIVQKVQKQPYVSKKELLEYLERELEFVQNLDDRIDVKVSSRTIERDLREIRTLVGINIVFSRSRQGYYIDEDNAFAETALHNLVDSFEMYHSLNLTPGTKGIVYVEKEHPQGTENMYGLIHAIMNRQRVSFVYTKFWDDVPMYRSGEPYAIKYKQRWYLLLRDDLDHRIKLFGLERMSALKILDEPYTPDPKINVDKMFRYSFGVTLVDEEPQEVVLDFSLLQAKYVRSVPIHPTQKIFSEKHGRVRVSLTVFLTVELEMQILSYGEEVRVVKPKVLADRIKHRLTNAMKLYGH